MTLLGVPQTFAIESSREMADKLAWEIEAYRAEPTLPQKLWCAFNCAVTAWHLADWLWKERVARGVDPSAQGAFLADVQARCKELRLCRYIANASKHRGVNRNPDPTIQVRVKAKPTAGGLSWIEVDNSEHWVIEISDKNGSADALMVFYKVMQFWDAEIHADERLLDPERYAPPTDFPGAS